MSTYNLSLVFSRHAVATIVCFSEEYLNTTMIADAASAGIGEMMGEEYSPSAYAQRLRDKICSQCGCETIVVMADAIIPLTGGESK